MLVQKILSKGLRSSDLTLVKLPGTECRIIQRNKETIWCSKYECLKGLFRKDIDETLSFGRKLCDSVADKMGNRGFLTTDERPDYGISYGISEYEYKKIFLENKADEEQDLVVIFAYGKKESEQSNEILYRLLEGMIRNNVPNRSICAKSYNILDK